MREALRGQNMDSPLSISQEREPNLFDDFNVQTSSKTSTIIPTSFSNVPIHKTSADEYFESRARGKVPTILSAESAPTVEALPEPERVEVGANHKELSTITEKTGSKLSSILGAHKDLVDLENIVTIQKRYAYFSRFWVR
ncbi:hypothetical protein ACTXT7_010297 [Hymenolepis weldensis]